MSYLKKDWLPVRLFGHKVDRYNVQSNNYWSSTTYESNPNNAWNVNMDNGNVNNLIKDRYYYVWPVRAGQ